MTNIKYQIQISKYKSCPMYFCTRFDCFRNINVSDLFPSQSRSRSLSTIFSVMPFNGKCENLQRIYIHKVDQNCTLLPWPTFWRSKIKNLYISETVKARKKMWGRHLQIWHLPSNDVTAKIALCDLDRLFSVNNLKGLYLWNRKS